MSEQNDEGLTEQLQNTQPLNYMLLNKNSVYCVMPQSSKPPDTCKWGGPRWPGILKFNRADEGLMLKMSALKLFMVANSYYNTRPLIYMSLNKNSVYCVMPQSSKPPDTCKWGGPRWPGILKFSRADKELTLQMSTLKLFMVANSCYKLTW